MGIRAVPSFERGLGRTHSWLVVRAGPESVVFCPMILGLLSLNLYILPPGNSESFRWTLVYLKNEIDITNIQVGHMSAGSCYIIISYNCI